MVKVKKVLVKSALTLGLMTTVFVGKLESEVLEPERYVESEMPKGLPKGNSNESEHLYDIMKSLKEIVSH